MIAGHYATALIAKQRVPQAGIGLLLVASQLPDLAWFALTLLGLEPSHAHGPKPLAAEMMLTHDLLPLLPWIALAAIGGRTLVGSWAAGFAAAVLVVVHELCDLLVGYPHNILGPQTLEVGLGLYYAAPTLGIAIEGVFAAVLIAWAARADARAGVRRSRSTWGARALIFGGGIGTMLFTASGFADLDPHAGLPPTQGLIFGALYAFQIAVLTWGETRPPAPGTKHRAKHRTQVGSTRADRTVVRS
jgi:hypothetical protein